jgi:hypothetical protein
MAEIRPNLVTLVSACPAAPRYFFSPFLENFDLNLIRSEKSEKCNSHFLATSIS